MRSSTLNGAVWGATGRVAIFAEIIRETILFSALRLAEGKADAHSILAKKNESRQRQYANKRVTEFNHDRRITENNRKIFGFRLQCDKVRTGTGRIQFGQCVVVVCLPVSLTAFQLLGLKTYGKAFKINQSLMHAVN